MRRLQNVEKWLRLRKPRIITSNQIDERVLDDSFAAMGQVKNAQSTDGEPKAWSIILRSRMTKVAAAAVMVIIVMIAFFIVPPVSREHIDARTVSQVTKSPAEMLTFMSLTMAYREGGIEAVDNQCDKAFEMLGPRQTVISIHQLMAELDAT